MTGPKTWVARLLAPLFRDVDTRMQRLEEEIHKNHLPNGQRLNGMSGEKK